MGLFNPEEFAMQEQEGDLSTQRLVYEGGVYPAVINAAEVVGGEKDGKEWGGLDVTWEVEDEGVKAAVKRDVVRCRQKRIFFELDEFGKLDKSEGANVDLGRLLKSVGLLGKSWSPAGLVGLRALVNIKRTPVKDSTEGDTRAEVVGTAAL